VTNAVPDSIVVSLLRKPDVRSKRKQCVSLARSLLCTSAGRGLAAHPEVQSTAMSTMQTAQLPPALPAVNMTDIGLMLHDLPPEDRSEMIRGLRVAFEQEAETAKRTMEDAYRTFNPQLLGAAAYKLVGTSRCVGARTLARLCEEIDRMIIANSAAAAIQRIPQLEREIDRVEHELALLGGE
jgi:HPt (histidine-containing phosphotransfer) domain-containing protein